MHAVKRAVNHRVVKWSRALIVKRVIEFSVVKCTVVVKFVVKYLVVICTAVVKFGLGRCGNGQAWPTAVK